MQKKTSGVLSDYDRLKEINSELSVIARMRKECRSKTSLYGAIAGALLALSVIALFQNLLSLDTDWVSNTNSPVYEEAAQDKSSKPFIVLSLLGLAGGMGLFVLARGQCREVNSLNSKERTLTGEMRVLRDKMYIKGRQNTDTQYRPKKAERKVPLGPDEVRGEYAGVYSPPGSHKSS